LLDDEETAMNLRAMRFRIGIFVLATLLLFAVLITLFGSFPHVFRRQNQYTVLFHDAGGVDSGTPVRRSGVRVGQVKDVFLDDESGLVHVVILVDRQHALRRNEQPLLVHGLLSGDTSIDFVARRTPEGQPVADRTPLEPGEEIEGMEAANVNTVINQAADVVPTTRETLDQIRKSLEKLEQLTPVTKATLEQYEMLARETRAVIPELRETNQQVQALTKDVRTLVPELGRTNSAIQELAGDTRKMIPELRRTNDEIQVTARNWGRLGERLDVLLQTNQDKLVRVVDQLNDTLSRVSNVFNDENQRNLSATLKNVRAGSENLGSISKGTDELIKQSNQTMGRINESLTRTNDVLNNLQQATKPMAERSASIVRNLDESTAKLNVTMTDVQNVLRLVTPSDGTLRRLLTDPSLYNHLDEAACMITRILPRLDPIMKNVDVFTDKLARHPEKLGLGGIVRPSSGLKDVPGDSFVPH
jgi:ABC-type transporter Mla subunit MlaD